MRRTLYGILLASCLVWILFTADKTGESTSGRIPLPLKGFLAPDFSLDTPTGTMISLFQERGQPVLLNMWATWCPPCREEMPALQSFYLQYKDQGLVVLGINSTVQDNPLDVVPFIDNYKLTFPILLDETGQVGQKYDLQSLPSTFFINRDGTIANVVIGGPMSDALLRTNIEEILKSPSN